MLGKGSNSYVHARPRWALQSRTLAAALGAGCRAAQHFARGVGPGSDDEGNEGESVGRCRLSFHAVHSDRSNSFVYHLGHTLTTIALATHRWDLQFSDRQLCFPEHKDAVLYEMRLIMSNRCGKSSTRRLPCLSKHVGESCAIDFFVR